MVPTAGIRKYIGKVAMAVECGGVGRETETFAPSHHSLAAESPVAVPASATAVLATGYWCLCSSVAMAEGGVATE